MQLAPGKLTVVVYKIRDTNAEQCRIETGIQARNALALDDLANRIDSGRLRLFRLYLRACG